MENGEADEQTAREHEKDAHGDCERHSEDRQDARGNKVRCDYWTPGFVEGLAGFDVSVSGSVGHDGTTRFSCPAT